MSAVGLINTFNKEFAALQATPALIEKGSESQVDTDKKKADKIFKETFPFHKKLFLVQELFSKKVSYANTEFAHRVVALIKDVRWAYIDQRHQLYLQGLIGDGYSSDEYGQ